MSCPAAGKALVRRFVEEGINQGRLDVMDEVLSPDYPPLHLGGDGREHVKELLALYRRAIPDACWILEEQVAEGDLVVTCFTALGTHMGPLLGLPATGKKMAISGVLVSRWAGDWIVAQWTQLDLLGLLQQLGLIPDLPLDQVVMMARLLREEQRIGPGADAGRRKPAQPMGCAAQ